MLLPGWSPFHIAKVSYWSRTVLVPLLVLMALRPRARNPHGVTINELFTEPPEAVRDWITGPTSSPWSVAFGMLDRLLRVAEPFFPADPRRRAIEKAVAFVTERLNGEDGLGDWAATRPGLRPGGWAFQFENPYYPDLDDTAAVALALHRFGPARYRSAVDRAAEWVVGMQSRNGGWGSFDADNTHYYLNHIPFADHGALLDPPTADVSARCLGFLTQLGHGPDYPSVAAAIAYLRDEQEPDGSWFGRWGTNYIYGTWSVLAALNSAGIASDSPEVRRAVGWLLARQHKDGGWGEGGESYCPEAPHGDAPYSTPSQTAWALLGLMAAGEAGHPAVAHGIAYLIESQDEDGNWDESWYTAVGFPRVFYLRYHGYRAFFPLWALARYRRLSRGNSQQVPYGL
jgi:squalene-hopene/tetraprenyl-beta-curcumene cyclase